MAGRDAKDPCAFDEEDGFALSFTMDVGAEDVAALPRPGQVFVDRIYVEPAGPATGTYVDAKIEVLSHEKPYIVVRITPATGALPEGIRSLGGIVRVRVRHEDERWVAPGSWSQ